MSFILRANKLVGSRAFAVLLAMMLSVAASLDRAYAIDYLADISAPIHDEDIFEGMVVTISGQLRNNGDYLDTGEWFTYYYYGRTVLAEDAGVVAHNNVYLQNTANKSEMWLLEEAGFDPSGYVAYYLKNVATGRYLTYTLKGGCDPSNPSSLPTPEDETEGAVQWFNEGGFANCCIRLTSTDGEDKKPFFFASPLDCKSLVGFPDSQLSAEAKDMIPNAWNKNQHTALMTSMEIDGELYYAALNASYMINNDVPYLSRYVDWGAMFVVNEVKVLTSQRDYANAISALGLHVCPIGTDPGLFTESSEVLEFNRQASAILDAAKTPGNYSIEAWEVMFAETFRLLEVQATLTPNPVVSGYYRFVCGMDAFKTKQGKEKAMYATETTLMWGNLDPDDKSQIWKVEQYGDYFQVTNYATGGFIKASGLMSGNVAMSATRSALTRFATVGSRGEWNITMNNTSYALHTGGHSSGAGVRGYIVEWNDGSNTGSAWYLRAVDESELELSVGERLQELADEVWKTLYETQFSGMDESDALVTGVGQLSSPATEPTEGALKNLIDGKPATFWHTTWSNASVALNRSLHYLQVDLGRGVQTVKMRYMRRRNVMNDFPTEFAISIGRDADGDFEVDAYVDADAASDEMQELCFMLSEPSRYIRVQASHTTNDRIYWHAAEMNFHELTGTSDFERTGEVGLALYEALVAAYRALEGVPVQADIDALRAAYTAYLAALADDVKSPVATAAQTGVYDLSGRRVGRASKGLYIVDGVKTLAR